MGENFSVGNLKNICLFYKTYVSDQIGETVFSQFFLMRIEWLEEDSNE